MSGSSASKENHGPVAANLAKPNNENGQPPPKRLSFLSESASKKLESATTNFFESYEEFKDDIRVLKESVLEKPRSPKKVGKNLVATLASGAQLLASISLLLAALAGVAAVYMDEIKEFLEPVMSLFGDYCTYVKEAMQTLAGEVFQAVKLGLDKFQGLLSGIWTFIKATWSTVVQTGRVVCGWIVRAGQGLYSGFQTYVMPMLRAVGAFAAANPWICVGIAVGVLVLVAGIYIWQGH